MREIYLKPTGSDKSFLPRSILKLLTSYNMPLPQMKYLTTTWLMYSPIWRVRAEGKTQRCILLPPLILDMTVNVTHFSQEIDLALRMILKIYLKGKKFFKTCRF